MTHNLFGGIAKAKVMARIISREEAALKLANGEDVTTIECKEAKQFAFTSKCGIPPHFVPLLKWERIVFPFYEDAEPAYSSLDDFISKEYNGWSEIKLSISPGKIALKEFIELYAEYDSLFVCSRRKLIPFGTWFCDKKKEIVIEDRYLRELNNRRDAFWYIVTNYVEL